MEAIHKGYLSIKANTNTLPFLLSGLVIVYETLRLPLTCDNVVNFRVSDFKI